MPGPEPKTYFAPDQIRKRNADWGPAEVTRRFNEAQLAFIREVKNPDQPWMDVMEHGGMDTAQRLVNDLVAGHVDPRQGHVVVFD